MSQINQKGRQLTGELQAICNAKRRQLDQKNTEIRLLSDNLQHGLRFAEYLLTLTDDAALLYSRRTLMHQLSAILRTRCEVPNPYHVVDLRFNASQLPGASNWSLGNLVVDGYLYGQGTIQGMHIPMSVRNGSQVTSSSPHRQFTPGTTTQGDSVLQMSRDQKLQKLLQMRMQKMEQLKQQAKPPDYFAGGSVVGGTSLYPSQMPNQSSNISSSNQHRQDAAMTGYVPAVHAKNYNTSHHSISLAQLQDERRQRMQNHREQVTTTLQPIVIQPTNLPDQSEFSAGFTVGLSVLR